VIRVAFTLIGGKNWTGGQNYLLNLLEVLVRYQNATLTPVLFVGEDGAEAATPFHAIPGLQLVDTSCLNLTRRKPALLQALLWGKDRCLARVFKQHRIDLVFESAQFFGWRLGVPTIAWIPDFQHRGLPHLFSRADWLKREIGFRAQVVGGRTVMLSSDDARQACEHYYPATQGCTHTIHFAIPPRADINYSEARAIADIYSLPAQFVFLPNQFWRHKNHELVLEALTILKQRGKHIVIAASGKQNDPRDPGYFPRFLATLKKRDMEQSFRLLGLIPYPHLMALMRSCTALLNPSLFEGWSTTVEEARAMGTPMVLSDLAVHREQMGEEAIYFERHSAQSLANALEHLAARQPSQCESQVENAREAALQRVEKFSRDFVNLAKHCVSQK
jgi:glycosyltransferase involved in cell wall biosynthesis